MSPGTSHALVRQYLLHYGYADTLAAFDAAAGITAAADRWAPRRGRAGGATADHTTHTWPHIQLHGYTGVFPFSFAHTLSRLGQNRCSFGSTCFFGRARLCVSLNGQPALCMCGCLTSCCHASLPVYVIACAALLLQRRRLTTRRPGWPCVRSCGEPSWAGTWMRRWRYCR